MLEFMFNVMAFTAMAALTTVFATIIVAVCKQVYDELTK